MTRRSASNPYRAPLALVFFTLLFLSNISIAQDAAGAEDGIPTDEAIVAAGEKLYKNNCTQCHDINDVVIGPALKDVHERRPKEWLIAWIKKFAKSNS